MGGVTVHTTDVSAGAGRGSGSGGRRAGGPVGARRSGRRRCGERDGAALSTTRTAPGEPAGGGGRWATCGSRQLVIFAVDVEAAGHVLRAGRLTCPECGGALRVWARARTRRVHAPEGRHVELTPDRGLCRGCGTSHVVVPAWYVPRPPGWAVTWPKRSTRSATPPEPSPRPRSARR